MTIVWGIGALAVMVGAGYFFWHHQRVLRDRAYLMREAIRNRDFTFRLPVRGLFFGERALQQTLNEMGQDVGQLVAQSEVESWQRLTRVLTHEIMNATAPIQSISQAYLNNPSMQGSPYEEGIRAIHATSTSLNAFVDSYRKLTQLQEPQTAPVPLHPFAQSLQALYPTLQWSIDIPEGTQLTADENMLRQVAINLTKNAIEAGARRMDVRWKSGALLISNDGEYIPAHIRREIFVPFFTTKRSGSGIGLSLSRQMLMAQKLHLTLADTPAPSYHVTFTITPTVR